MTNTRMLPLFPLPVVLFPGSILPLHIFEPRYKLMISECLEQESHFGVIPAEGDRIHPVGCTARITNVLHRYPDGRLDILTVGEERFRVCSYDSSREYLQGQVACFKDKVSCCAKTLHKLSEEVVLAYRKLADIVFPEGAPNLELKAEANGSTAFFIASALCLPFEFRSQLLESTSEEDRLRLLKEMLERALGGGKEDDSDFLSGWYAQN